MAEQFVCVRIQSMNGVNLNQFQFEFDLTWMAFFQDASGRTYARYGGREDHDAESHLNKTALLRVMRRVLALHKVGEVQPANRYEPVAESVRTPEDIPSMLQMISRRKESCIHCHDVKVAQLRDLRDNGRIEKDMVYTYPRPSQLGIQIDAEFQQRVDRVDPKSPAAEAGIEVDDRIRTIDGQRVLTLADMSRVLELAPQSGSLEFGVERGNRNISTVVQLPKGWRKSNDPSWRASTHILGPSSGFWGVQLNRDQRRRLGIGDEDLALRVTAIWSDWARKAGVRNGDYLLSLDGRKSHMTIRQLQAYLHLNRNWGETVDLVVRRNGKDLKLTLRFPDRPPND